MEGQAQLCHTRTQHTKWNKSKQTQITMRYKSQQDTKHNQPKTQTAKQKIQKNKYNAIQNAKHNKMQNTTQHKT